MKGEGKNHQDGSRVFGWAVEWLVVPFAAMVKAEGGMNLVGEWNQGLHFGYVKFKMPVKILKRCQVALLGERSGLETDLGYKDG